MAQGTKGPPLVWWDTAHPRNPPRAQVEPRKQPLPPTETEGGGTEFGARRSARLGSALPSWPRPWFAGFAAKSPACNVGRRDKNVNTSDFAGRQRIMFFFQRSTENNVTYVKIHQDF